MKALPFLLFIAQISMLSGEEIEFSFSAAWDSKYVSEGRDNLDEGGLFWSELIGTYGNSEVVVFRGDGDSANFGEWNIGVAHSVDLGDFSLTGSYTYLYESPGGEEDHELALEFAAPTLAGFESSLAFVYSTEAEGVFAEIIVEKEYILSDTVSLIPDTVLGFNDGYVQGEPNGVNHLQLGVTLSYAIRENVGLNLFAHHSFGIADGLDDVTWFGVNIDLGGSLSKHGGHHSSHHEY